MKVLTLFIFFISLNMTSFAKEELFSTIISPSKAWKYLNDSRYERLPYYKVTYSSFISKIGENLLNKDSKRTVKEKDHFIPFQRKLIFPNGICVRGLWEINSYNNGYTGYFKKNSKGVVIGRFSAATGKIFYNQYRTLGLSGKIFPTINSNDTTRMDAANFITMNAGGGGNTKEYVTEAFYTNAAPTTAPLRNLPLLRAGLAISDAFESADIRKDIRQLYQIAELGAKSEIRSPKWLWLKANDEQQLISHELKKADFREETMGIIDTKGELSFDIMISDKLEENQPIYEKIGVLRFDEYVVSAACDQSIHFQHLPYLKEYGVVEVDQNPKEIRKRRMLKIK